MYKEETVTKLDNNKIYLKNWQKESFRRSSNHLEQEDGAMTNILAFETILWPLFLF